MLRYFGAVLVGLLTALAINASPPAEREAAIKVIDRAIQAQGGPAQVARLQSVAFKAKCSVNLGDRSLAYEGIFAAHYPDCCREEVLANLGGQVQRVIMVVRGDTGFSRVIGADMSPLPAARLLREKTRLHQSYRATLLPLKQKEFTLRLVGPAEVTGRKATAIAVSSLGQPNETFFFDDETGLLVKVEVLIPNGPFGQLRPSEMHFLDYKEAGGVRYPSRSVSYVNGKKSAELEMTEFTPGVTHAPAAFLWP